MLKKLSGPAAWVEQRTGIRLAMSEQPNVPLPTGVAAAGSWQPNDPLPYRIVLGEDHGVTDHNVVVHTVATQFADGRIVDGRIKAATVYSGRGLSSTQARELSAALLAAADDLDRWAGTTAP